MKRKIYTQINFDDWNSKSLNEEIFTSEDHAKLSKLQFKEKSINSREELIRMCLKNNLKKKLIPFYFLIEKISQEDYKKILSLGSGSGELEYFVSLSLNNYQKLYAAEFDKYLVKKANQFFHEFETFEFNFFKDAFQSIQHKFDLVFSFGSFYVMDDNQFIKLFKDMKASGVKEIIDFHAGYMTWKQKIKYWLKSIISIFYKSNKESKNLQNKKFHGFARDRSELIRLYKKAGWEPVQEIRNCGIYKFICILN